jgi:hypothetical protein
MCKWFLNANKKLIIPAEQYGHITSLLKGDAAQWLVRLLNHERQSQEIFDPGFFPANKTP